MLSSERVRSYWLQLTLLAMTLVTGFFWYQRSKLPYNAEGRWLDEEQMLVYHQQSVLTLSVVFVLSMIVFLLSLVWRGRRR